MKAAVSFLMLPTSTAPPMPTKPPARPPANEKVLMRLPARTVTPCWPDAPALPLSRLMRAPLSTQARVSLSISVIATPPAMPTKPPPAAIARWVTSSLLVACTTTPCAVVVLNAATPLALPSSTPPMPVPKPLASTALLAPM